MLQLNQANIQYAHHVAQGNILHPAAPARPIPPNIVRGGVDQKGRVTFDLNPTVRIVSLPPWATGTNPYDPTMKKRVHPKRDPIGMADAAAVARAQAMHAHGELPDNKFQPNHHISACYWNYDDSTMHIFSPILEDKNPEKFDDSAYEHGIIGWDEVQQLHEQG